ncbi:STAS domain-containing protein [Halalkalibacter nanhaiisediminis]|uniref:RsbT co-antagonist protein RsbR n=1 Tax=Halalkalibacter nanhaiisediminis TaxID=688079 RepID=A0A562QCJ5_9BACI|nr:STAS domain-containing protein [Halalkalibacter nanhaiisediminis]TWI54468.1 rsbT co-antagonist protein RsbR [Halalkalibacter nanhaiisediminis]
MSQLNDKVAQYFQAERTEITNLLLPKTLNELNLDFSKEDLEYHFEMLNSLLYRVSNSLVSTKEETVASETGYDTSNYFFNRGVMLRETVNVLCVFRLSLLKYLRQSDLIDGSEIHEGFIVFEEIIFAFDEAIRATTQNFNNQIDKNKKNMEKELDKISVPVVLIDDKRAVLPLVGDFTSGRLQSLVDRTLAQVMEKNVEAIILDFSGIAAFDTYIAKSLFNLIHALELIGTKTIITGVHPSMAQTAVELGIDFSSIESYGSLRQVLNKS